MEYKIVEEILPEIPVEGLTNKKGNIRKTVHQYDKCFEGNFGQAREQLILETTWLGNYEPFTIENVGSYESKCFNKKMNRVLPVIFAFA